MGVVSGVLSGSALGEASELSPVDLSSLERSKLRQRFGLVLTRSESMPHVFEFAQVSTREGGMNRIGMLFLPSLSRNMGSNTKSCERGSWRVVAGFSLTAGFDEEGIIPSLPLPALVELLLEKKTRVLISRQALRVCRVEARSLSPVSLPQDDPC